MIDQPELQAEMLTMMGRTYERLGEHEKARQLLEQALVSGRKAFGPEHVRVAQTLDYLGAMLANKGDNATAARTLEQALEMRRKLLGTEHADVAVTLVELGRVYQDQGLNDRAEDFIGKLSTSGGKCLETITWRQRSARAIWRPF